MTFISKKKIHGKARYYLEQSVRHLDGKTKKYSIYLKEYLPSQPFPQLKAYEKALKEKIAQELSAHAREYYHRTSIFDKETLGKLEEIKLGYRELIKKLTKNQMKDVLDRFTVNFTYNSNALEGNSLTLKDVTFILQEGRIAKGKELREVYETLNAREVIEWIFQERPAMSEATIIKMHAMLVKDTGVSLGYKKFPNFLLGRTVQTTPPESVRTEIQQLLDEYHKNKKTHPLQRAAHFHGKFEKIHPFEDGNGRTGRILVNAMLLHEGYPPLIIRRTQRIAYFNALAACDTGYEGKLYRFLLDKYKETYEKFFKVYVQYL